MKPILHIIKIGGNVIDNDALLEQFLADFSNVPEYKILVHGGGKLASALSEKLGIAPNIIEGRRITDAHTLKIVCMVYAGLINKTIAAKLQSKNCNAIGLSGPDGNIISATKRPVKEVDFGFVGDVNDASINSSIINKLLRDGLIPVIAPVTHDTQGQLLNTNADTIASALAVAMAPVYSVNLLYCFERNGVLMNMNNEDSLIPHINTEKYADLKASGAISGGMIPKLDNAFAALQQGVANVNIGHASNLKNILKQENNAASRLSL